MNRIGETTTKAGLKIHAPLDVGRCVREVKEERVILVLADETDRLGGELFGEFPVVERVLDDLFRINPLQLQSVQKEQVFGGGGAMEVIPFFEQVQAKSRKLKASV